VKIAFDCSIHFDTSKTSDMVMLRIKFRRTRGKRSEEHRTAQLTHTEEIGLGAQVLERACKDITVDQ
jgi:hypothetical protein